MKHKIVVLLFSSLLFSIVISTELDIGRSSKSKVADYFLGNMVRRRVPAIRKWLITARR